jgi:hypothetical protein
MDKKKEGCVFRRKEGSKWKKKKIASLLAVLLFVCEAAPLPHDPEENGLLFPYASLSDIPSKQNKTQRQKTNALLYNNKQGRSIDIKHMAHISTGTESDEATDVFSPLLPHLHTKE